jgi:hypothetical protein
MNNFDINQITKFKITPLGIEQYSQLTVEEWKNLGAYIGSAARSMAFVIGDWIMYGNTLLGTVGEGQDCPQSDTLKLATECTGIDIKTLESYAHVARKLPMECRSERLSWEHHKVIAKIPHHERTQWIDLCHAEQDVGRHVTVRRLRKSLNLGRLATDKDLEPDRSDNGIENHLPFVNRLVVWWKRMQADRFLADATPEQRETLKRDLEPIISIYNQL